jgi:hypothetical protein
MLFHIDGIDGIAKQVKKLFWLERMDWNQPRGLYRFFY